MKRIFLIALCMTLIGSLRAQVTLIPFNDTWKYLDNGTDQGTAWRNASFNDAAWNTGNGKLGYGGTFVNTTVSFGPNASKKYATTYFRKHVTIADPSAYSHFTAMVRRDDGVVVYVNGTEVIRNNMSTGTIGYDSLATVSADDDGADVQVFTINSAAFVPGDNVIAVEVHQQKRNSGDLAFDMKLVTPDAVAPNLLFISRHLPALELASSASVTFRVVFSEGVTGVSRGDFSLSLTGSASGSLATDAVQKVDEEGTTYNVTVSGVAGLGSLRLNLKAANTGIADYTGNPIPSVAFTSGQTYNIDRIAPSTVSINRLLPAAAATNASALTWQVNFSEPVSALDLSDFTVETLSGTPQVDPAALSLAPVGTSGSEFQFTAGTVGGAGELRLNLNAGTDVTDLAGNGISSAFNTGETYQLDGVRPAVASIRRQLPLNAITPAASVTFRVIFTEPVTGVESTDFLLHTTQRAGGSMGSLAAVGTDGSTYDLTVDNLTGEGFLNIELKSAGTGIADLLGNEENSGYTGSETYQVDRIFPALLTSSRLTPSTVLTNAGTVTFRVVFSEPVFGLAPPHFTITGTGSAAGLLEADAITQTDATGTIYDIEVRSLAGGGDLRLDFSGAAGVADIAGNAVPLFNGGEAYTVDRILPAVSGIFRSQPLAQNTSLTNVTWRVVFTEPVSGIDPTDFSLATVSGSAAGMLPAVITAVGTEGTTFDVAVHSITGEGLLRLDLNTGIELNDLAGNALQDGFSTGQMYSVEDDLPPFVATINRQSAQELTNAGLLSFRVVFSEPVTGVDLSDFSIVAGGTVTASLSSVGTIDDGTTYDVSITGITGDGTLAVSVAGSGTGILDLLGNSLTSQAPAVQSYSIDQTAPVVLSISRQDPATESTTSPQLTWRISFSEPVTGVNAAAMVLSTVTGNVGGAVDPLSITAATPDGTTWDVIANNCSGTGSLRLDMTGHPALTDGAGNALVQAFGTGQAYHILDVTPPVVANITRYNPGNQNSGAASLTWRLSFSEPVSAVPFSNLALVSVSGTAAGTLDAGAIVAADATGQEYYITASNITGAGELRLDIMAAPGSITDLEGNPLASGFTGGELYYTDRIAPQVSSIVRRDPVGEQTPNSSVQFRVQFSEAIAGLDAADFSLSLGGDAAGNILSVQAVSASVYDVQVDQVTGNGNLRLDLNAAGTGITDELGNAINGGFSSGEAFRIDQLPTVSSISRQAPLNTLTSAASVTFRVLFSEPVSGVDLSDFTLATGGTASGTLGAVQAVGTDGIGYDVTISSVSGMGSFRLDLNSTGTGITDQGGNNIATGFNGGQEYSIDRVLPAVLGISRHEPAAQTTIGSYVTWRVVFSEGVTGVNAPDFLLTATGSAVATISPVSVNAVSADGTTYDVTVNSIGGEGTLRLDLNTTGTYIYDLAGNRDITGFNQGETYSVDRILPVVSSILRFQPTSNGTTDTVVTYRVTFSEGVTGVSADDFTLTFSGATTAVVASDAVVPTATPNIYDVKVSAIYGIGTLRLDLKSSGTGISDLPGNAIATGYTSGQVYSIDQSPVVVSINRQLPLSEATSAASLTYRITFSKKVTGVTFDDFIVSPQSGNVRGTLILLSNEAAGSVAQNAVQPVGTSGMIYDLTVRAVNGSGSLRVDLLPSGTGIKDVAGNPIRSGYTSGESYNITASTTEGFSSFTDINPLAISAHTGEKPQAKLWKYAGKWWGVFATSTGTKIFRMDANQWVSGADVVMTSHGSTKNDCVMWGDFIYILCFRTGDNNDSYIMSAQYDPVKNIYVKKSKFPLKLGETAETATMAIDATGRMWVANDGVTDIVVRWSDFPYSVWSAPITIASGTSTDDICAIVAMPGKVGVLWSNQNTQRFYFSTHANGAPPTTWSVQPEEAAVQSAKPIGLGFSDDHLNILCGSDGTLYCAVKTSYEVPGTEKLALLVRRPAGTWDNLYPVTANEGTRPIVLLNEAAGKVRIAYSSHENGGDILYRESPLANISFGRPFTLLGGNPDLTYNFVTSTHQVCNSESVIVATDQRVGVDYAVTIFATDNAPSTATSGRLPSKEITAVSEQGAPTGRTTLAALPNPFAGNTNVQFTLPESGAYRLTLYNTMGVKLRDLAAGTGEAGQQKTIQFNGTMLASGLYLLRLQTNTTATTIKLLRQ